MSKKSASGLKSILFAMTLIAPVIGLIPAESLAQQSGGTNMSAIEPRNAVSVILMSGLVGGILGLSTLSFYDRPQDNIRNITIGAGLGMITAALFMTYTVSQTAAPPKSASFEWAPTVGYKEAGVLASLHF
jgi:hypothetical protein